MPTLSTKSHSKHLPQRQFQRNLSYPEKVIGKTTSDYFDTLFGNDLKLTNGGSKLIHRNSQSDMTTKARHADKETIAVLGSGNFGRAIATKISQSAYDVVIGSRDPEKYR